MIVPIINKNIITKYITHYYISLNCKNFFNKTTIYKNNYHAQCAGSRLVTIKTKVIQLISNYDAEKKSYNFFLI